MASASASTASTLPPDLFDTTTLVSLASTLLIVAAAYTVSRIVLPSGKSKGSSKSTPPALRFLFIWHLADALCHFILEGSFLYHCFFSWVPVGSTLARGMYPTAPGFLGHYDRVYGPQAGGENPFAQLWMVYARADRRWAGADLDVISLELLTVIFDGLLAVYICYCIAKQDPKANIWMIVLAVAELYGGFMTFCPEWLTGNPNFDTSNFMYKWVYLVFFNMLWVFIPLYAIWYAVGEISAAFQAQSGKKRN